MSNPSLTPSTVHIHPKLGIEWHAYKLFDGTIYVDPANPQIAAILEQIRNIAPHTLSNHLPELGRGNRGIVYDAGDFAVKKCVTDLWPERTGIKAVAANMALAVALRNRPQQIGSLTLAGCMPRGLFQPHDSTRPTTWVMDKVLGQDGESFVGAPDEAMYWHNTQAACRDALAAEGLDPALVYVDPVPKNMMIDQNLGILTVIDVMSSQRPGSSD